MRGKKTILEWDDVREGDSIFLFSRFASNFFDIGFDIEQVSNSKPLGSIMCPQPDFTWVHLIYVEGTLKYPGLYFDIVETEPRAEDDHAIFICEVGYLIPIEV